MKISRSYCHQCKRITGDVNLSNKEVRCWICTSNKNIKNKISRTTGMLMLVAFVLCIIIIIGLGIAAYYLIK